MVFSSPRFLAFLLCVLVLLWFRFGHTTKKRLLAAASCLFYAAWDYRYLALLLIVSLIDYVCASRIAGTESTRRRRVWLLFSIVSNLGILGYFKYYNFFVENLNGLLTGIGVSLPQLAILLPAGISFFTFKSMSYTIDVYLGHIDTCENQLDYTMFVTFFPELIAGPIVRASVFLPQMQRTIGPTRERLRAGFSLFLLGLTKKLFIADRIAVISDTVFANPVLYDSPTIWIGVMAYTVQIYCDFAGYSDMAIGTALMLGYELPENFDMPYLSTSITEFWRRWHITLSSWLRDYLYIPLGGNRKGKGRTYVNLMITMLLGGLWHGASWNFVLWGGLHGTALAAHKALRDLRKGRELLPAWLGGVATLLFVMLTWVPFRSRDWTTTRTILSKMLSWQAHGAHWIPPFFFFFVGLVVAGHLLGYAVARMRTGGSVPVLERLLDLFGARVETSPISGPYVVFGWGNFAGAFLMTLWVLVVVLLSPSGTSPFIYFQF